MQQKPERYFYVISLLDFDIKSSKAKDNAHLKIVGEFVNHLSDAEDDASVGREFLSFFMMEFG